LILRMSTMFLRTLRDDPSDADVPSHRLLVRAGYVRRVAPGIYSWLPLGKIVLENVTRIVREEMDRIGAQEVLFPALLPREYYEPTGRWTEYGDLLFRLRDRRGADYLLGPTHEEMFTALVKGEYSSYKDLPLILYQIQTKYRDEARPRAGILRGREFVMKDSYSFDLDDAALQRSYDLHRSAYIATFERLGIDYRIVSAVSGAMGGSASEEFLAPSPSGEDTFVSCASCGYAANTEAVRSRPPEPADPFSHPAIEVLDTPDTPTIDTLVDFFNEHVSDRRYTGADTLKNVVVKLVRPERDEDEILAVGVPGDRDVDLERLAAAVAPAEVQLLDDADFEARPHLAKGYIGPQGMAGSAFRYLADPRVARGTSWITGANDAGRHARNVVCGRDFEVDGYIDVVQVRTGDPCPDCAAPLSIDRGIEIGHIFQLGRKYADAAGLDVLGPDGKPVRVTMGSYGIGVSRLIASIAEQTYDEQGLRWPRSIAPAHVHIVATGKEDQISTALGIAGALEASGVPVMVDDRVGVSAGVKFKDAELIGAPTIVIVGKGLAEGVIEIKSRRSGERRTVSLADAADEILAARD
jgi:prolyl-tRNA synthetase